MEARNANSILIKPLTKKSRDGVRYTCRPDAELQIEKSLSLEKTQILAMLSGNKRRDEADFLLDETIVYLLREAKTSGDGNFIETLYLELNRRIGKLLSKFRGNFQQNLADF